MVAAATVVDQGANVIVLEKMAMIGGNTARSEGNMSAVDPEPEKLQPMPPALHEIVKKYLTADVPEGEIKALQDKVKEQYAAYLNSGKKYIFDTPELFALQTLIGGDNKGDPKLVLTMAENADEAMEWLDRQSDMTWEHRSRNFVDMGIGALYPRAMMPRGKDGKTPISTYDAYIGPLADKVKAAGSTILTNMKVTDLVQEQGRRFLGSRSLCRRSGFGRRRLRLRSRRLRPHLYAHRRRCGVERQLRDGVRQIYGFALWNQG